MSGHYLETSAGSETIRAFVPDPLPPDLSIGEVLREHLDQALISLGRLSASTEFLPDTKLLLYLYVRKEAVLSSQIEGTQSSLSELLLFEIDEAPGVPLADVSEVSCYVAALAHVQFETIHPFLDGNGRLGRLLITLMF